MSRNMLYIPIMAIFWSYFQLPTQSFLIHEPERARVPRQLVVINATTTPNSTFESGIGCGTIRMRPDHVIQIQSNNFPVGNYNNKDACTWIFTASDCDLSVYCPCFDVPSSFGCLEDYLKIGYLKFHDRFCGDNPPVGAYRATSDFLTLRFRSDYKRTGKGFLCFVRCTKVGSADPLAPSNFTCPDNAKNPFGSPFK